MKSEYNYIHNNFTTTRFIEIEIYTTYYHLRKFMDDKALERLFGMFRIPINTFSIGAANKPSKYEMIVCFRAAGMSQNEIARQFNISPNTILKHSRDFFHSDPQPTLFHKTTDITDEIAENWIKMKRALTVFNRFMVV